MAQAHRRFEDEGADAAVLPVVHVGPADAGVLYRDEDIVIGLEFGDWAVFEAHLEGRFENEREVLQEGLAVV